MNDHDIPDIRDGLTRMERIVLQVLSEVQREHGDRNAPTAMLWSQVCEHLWIEAANIGRASAPLQAILATTE